MIERNVEHVLVFLGRGHLHISISALINRGSTRLLVTTRQIGLLKHCCDILHWYPVILETNVLVSLIDLNCPHRYGRDFTVLLGERVISRDGSSGGQKKMMV